MKFNEDKIQELYPEAKMFEAQLIAKTTDQKLKEICDSGSCFGQLKKDGYWYQFEKHENHSYLFSRSASKKTGLLSEKSGNIPHIMAALDCLPKDTILIGEIYYPRGTSKDVTSIMGCLSPKAILRQEGSYGKIHYYIHDILMYDGNDFVKCEVSNYDRYLLLSAIFTKFNLDKHPFLELAKMETEDLYSKIGTALKNGEEGMVMKVKDGIYSPGLRPKTMLKAKQVDFADAVIMGFGLPNKEYGGTELDSWEYWVDKDDVRVMSLDKLDRKGAVPVTKPYFLGWTNAKIKIGAYDDSGKMIEIGTIHSGLSDSAKSRMTSNPEQYLNKVCSIQVMSKDNNKKTLRHGFFKGIRSDKNAEDCTLKEIFG